MRARPLLLVALSGAVALLLWDYAGFQAHALAHLSSTGDFSVMWRTAHTFAAEGYRLPPAGSTGLVYDGAYPVYPPTFFLLLLPISSLPLATASVAWLVLLQAAVAATIAVIYVGIGRPSLSEALVGGILVLALVPLRIADLDGQVSPLLAVLAAAALLATQHRARVLGGALVGLAIAIKLWPALLLAYFAWRRQWGVLVGAGGCLVALVLATLALGWGGRWLHYPATLAALRFQPGAAGDHSIVGAASRLLTGRTTAAAAGAPAVSLLALVLGVLLVLAAAAAIHRLGTRDRLNQWIGFGLLLAVSPVVLPFAWIHYWVLAVVLLVAAVRAGRLERLGTAATLQLVVAYTLLEAAYFLAYALVDADPSRRPALLWASVGVPLACALLVGAVWSMRTGSAPGRGQGEGEAAAGGEAGGTTRWARKYSRL